MTAVNLHHGHGTCSEAISTWHGHEHAETCATFKLLLQDMGQSMAGPSGQTARATTVIREDQENEGDVRNRQAGTSGAAPEPAQKEPEGPCPNRCPPDSTPCTDSCHAAIKQSGN